jgi:hypothetical protein
MRGHNTLFEIRFFGGFLALGSKKSDFWKNRISNKAKEFI